MSLYRHIAIISILVLIAQTSCGIYSFTGISLDPGVKTVYIESFDNLASTIVPTLTLTVEEKMKDKFTSEARLNLSNGSSGDVEFGGAILNYFVEPVASGADDRAAQSRLTISIRVEYTNNITGDTWSDTFQHYENFDSNQTLSDVETQLIDIITQRIVDDVFNKAFSNW